MLAIKWKEKGNKRFNTGDFVGALDAYTNALDSINDSDLNLKVILFSNKAECYLRLNDGVRAQEHAEQALIHDCDHDKSQNRYLRALKQQINGRSDWCSDSLQYSEKYKRREKHDAVCDICRQFPIIGQCWKCEICEDFDSCQKCYSIGGKHDKEHSFKVVELKLQDQQVGIVTSIFGKYTQIRHTLTTCYVEIEQSFNQLYINYPPLRKLLKRYLLHIRRTVYHIQAQDECSFSLFNNANLMEDTKETIIFLLQDLFYSMGNSVAGSSSISFDLDIEKFVDWSATTAILLGYCVFGAEEFTKFILASIDSDLGNLSDFDSLQRFFDHLLIQVNQAHDQLRKFNEVKWEITDELLFQYLDPRTWFYIARFILAEPQKRIFLSHRGIDMKSILTKYLEFGHDRYFIDCLYLPSGQSCRRFIIENLVRSSDVIFILTENFWDSPWCKEEVVIWQVLCKFRKLVLSNATSRAAFFWSSPTNDTVLNQIKSEGVQIQAIEKEFGNISELLEGISEQKDSWYSENLCGETSFLLGFAEPQFLCAETFICNERGCSLKDFIELGLRSYSLLSQIRARISHADIIRANHPHDFVRSLEEFVQTERKLAGTIQLLQNLRIDFREHFRRTFICEELNSSHNLQTLHEKMGEAMEYATDVATECASAILHDEMTWHIVSPARRRAYVIVLGILGCVFERIRDVCSLLLGQNQRGSWVANLSDSNDDVMDPTELPVLVQVAIGNIGDAYRLFYSIDDVEYIVKRFDWDFNCWRMIALGLQEQYYIRRTVFLKSSLSFDNKIAVRILGAPIIVYVVMGRQHSFYTDIIVLLYMLGLKSRTVMISLTREDESGLNVECGSVTMNEIPHFTLDSMEDILWTFGRPDNIDIIIRKFATEYFLPITLVGGVFKDTMRNFPLLGADGADINNIIFDSESLFPATELIKSILHNVNLTICNLVMKGTITRSRGLQSLASILRSRGFVRLLCKSDRELEEILLDNLS